MSLNVAELNTRFGLAGQLTFHEVEGGLIMAEIRTAQGHAELCLQGGHLTTWTPAGQTAPVIWLSDAAKFAPGKSIRGGVPVCWPWFGPHASEPKFPGHGFARTVPWKVTETRTLPDGSVELLLFLFDDDATRAQWPHATRLDIRVTVGQTLRISLDTHNLGDNPVTIGEALHTYFRISDIAEIAIHGLEGVSYVDKVDGGARKVQSGAVRCAGEVDRVYVDTGSACVIEDPGLKRRIHVGKQHSLSTVVWTPWQEKAEKMGDMGTGARGQGGWREMVCVESGNALENAVMVAPGECHRLIVEYSVSAL